MTTTELRALLDAAPSLDTLTPSCVHSENVRREEAVALVHLGYMGRALLDVVEAARDEADIHDCNGECPLCVALSTLDRTHG